MQQDYDNILNNDEFQYAVLSVLEKSAKRIDLKTDYFNATVYRMTDKVVRIDIKINKEV